MSLIKVGQAYAFEVIPTKFLQGAATKIYADGRALFFYFSPYYAFLLMMTVGFFLSFFVFNKKVIKKERNKKILVFFVLLVAGQELISSAYSAFLPTLSILHSISGVSLAAFLWIAIKYISSQSVEVKKNIYQEIYRQILAVAFFQSVIVLMQALLRSNLGLLIEISQSISTFGFGADESFSQFRPIGLFAHANNLANYFLILLFAINLFSDLVKEIKWFKWTSLILVILSLVLTLSRASYLAVFIYFLNLFLFSKKEFLNEWKFLIDFFWKHKRYLYIILFFITMSVAPRVIQTLYSFGSSGGFSNRSELVSLSFEIFKKYPLMGVGKSMFIPAGFATNPAGVISYFPESVHNGFLLVLVEQGFIGLILKLFFLYFFIKQILSSPFSKYVKNKIIFSLLSLAIVMFFHPINNILSIYTLLVILIL